MSALRLDAARAEAGAALTALYGSLRERSYGAPAEANGQLIRPLLSVAGAESLGVERDGAFWAAAAAVQLAHEASLLHDDVIDAAAVRRDRPTLAASRGTAAALVEGDHLLTTSYRLAAGTGATLFFDVFTHAVERTVAGEKLQGRAAGMVLDERAYRRIIGGKSGELLGCALAAAAYVRGAPAASSLYVLGRRTGELYQMLDDLLDYCPDVDTGKPALGDYAQRRWTWPLLEVATDGFDEEPSFVAERLAALDATGSSPLRRCLRRFEREVEAIRAAIAVHMPADVILSALVDDWHVRASDAVARVEAGHARRATLAELKLRLPADDEILSFFAGNSRTFSFAARAFPAQFRARVAGVYAFCRVTDDIADGPPPGDRAASLSSAVTLDGDTSVDGSIEERSRLLDLWLDLARVSHAGTETGVPLLDRVMREAALSGVPFVYVEELIEGMRMDLRGRRYASLDELRSYSYRVAGVIGQWLTRMCGVHDAAVLEHAADLGHAMQFTNIVRDAGEDLRVGRVYIPADMLADAGLDEASLHAFANGAPITEQYRALLEDLMAAADAHYAAAMSAAGALPPFFRRAIVIAAHVYRGIHDEVRANGYDNIHRRAHTSTPRKLALALRAMRSSEIATAQRERETRPARAPVTRPARAPERRPELAQEHALSPHGTPSPMLAAPQTAATETPAARVQTAAAQADPAMPRAQRAGRRTAGRIVATLVAGAAALPALVNAQTADVASGRWSVVDHSAATEWERHLRDVRSLYFAALDDATLVRHGHTAVTGARVALPVGVEDGPLLIAYEGAFTALEARHGSWPIARYLRVRDALRLLDAAVEAAPDHLEIRYLRMINVYHLPSLFGRADQAAGDLAILRRDLPDAASGHPPMVYRAMAAFVLEHGAPTAREREVLARALRRLDTRALDEEDSHE